MWVRLDPIDADAASLTTLVLEARTEGYSHIDRLVEGWRNGKNRFDKCGELLLAAIADDERVGVGGLNIDPYLDDPRVGRIRHVYVSPRARGAGVGRALVEQLLAASIGNFDLVRVRAAAAGGAAQFYDALGFERIAAVDASHVIRPAAGRARAAPLCGWAVEGAR